MFYHSGVVCRCRLSVWGLFTLGLENNNGNSLKNETSPPARRFRKSPETCTASLFWLPKLRPRHLLAPGGKNPKNRQKCCLKRAQIAKNVTSPHARDGGKSPQSLTRRTNRRCSCGPFSGNATKPRSKNGIATSSRPGSAATRAQQTQFLT